MILDAATDAKITEFIEKDFDSVIADLRRLVRIPSITTPKPLPGDAPYGEECKKVVDEFIKIGNELGMDHKNCDYHMVELSMGTQEKSLDIFSHLDVVPEGNGWIYPPFDVTVDKGFIIGRGTADDKGGTVAALHAMKCLKELNFPLKHKVRLVAGCNEENGMADIEYYLSKEPAPEFAFIPDVCFPIVVGEYGMFKTELEIPSEKNDILLDLWSGLTFSMVPDRATAVIKGDITAFLGELSEDSFDISLEDGCTKIVAKGISAHGSRAYEGKTAIKPLLELLLDKGLLTDKQAEAARKVLALVEDNDGIVFGMQCADEVSGPLMHVVGMLWTEDDKLIVNCNIRYPITADAQALKEKYEKYISENGLKLRSFLDLPPFYVSPEDKRVQALLSAWNYVTGREGKAVTTPGDTYARHMPCAISFGPLWPEVTFPLGWGHGAVHMPDECMTIEQYKEMIKVYAIGIIELDNVL